MTNILDVSISSVTELSAERSIEIVRALLRAECHYAKLSPSALTISSRLTAPDGGIDAEVKAPDEITLPSDCIIKQKLTGIQIKSGTSFTPWTESAIRGELLNKKGQIQPEVKRLIESKGSYMLICTGHDLTPERRNDSRQLISDVLTEVGIEGYYEQVEVLGASQIAEYAERYPRTASLLSFDPIQEAWLINEWQRDAHMSNTFEASSEQTQLIEQIREGILGKIKHIRILGEPGLGKTRVVLEAVKDSNIAPYVLYLQHGTQFGQTRLFRQLLKSGYDKPLVLVIDELPESELSDIWRHLKPICGNLKIITLDHGRDETSDKEIERLQAPRLSDDTIKQILSNRVGESRELDRWVTICEGSPRVAQAVADNLLANPDDILKPPSTVPIWSRFLHGYDKRNNAVARQIDCVAEHLALFSRFGYEVPVGDEAKYIASIINESDPTIGWARFQEIIHSLRTRRVLQGSRTLFFVPKALHIYLWKRFWEHYGRGFDFMKTFNAMPSSLHSWFMNMFKYAGEGSAAYVIEDILKPDGIFSQQAVLTSPKGAQVLSILAEANPSAVLSLLEVTIGNWTDEELMALSESRQQFVWTLEKIAVWTPCTVRALRLLSRLALNENATNSNNSTGILLGLFNIGMESAATESPPSTRLPVILELLRSSDDKKKKLGLKAIDCALKTRGGGFRTIGPEYQGIKERAKLWKPATYGEWWEAYHEYFQALITETQHWPSHLRSEVCGTLLDAIDEQIKVPPCTELAFEVLGTLVEDSMMSPEKLNKFFWNWREYKDYNEHREIIHKLREVERRYTRRNITNRFQRYIIDVDWMEWDEDFRERHDKKPNRSKTLVKALANRITRHPEIFNQIKHLLTTNKNTPALWYFIEQLAEDDKEYQLLPIITQITIETENHVCLHSYLHTIRNRKPELYLSTVKSFFSKRDTAWIGATITLRDEYNDNLFVECLNALEKGWLEPQNFHLLGYGKAFESIPHERVGRLLQQLSEHNSKESLLLLIELLDSIPFDNTSVFNSNFVFEIVSNTVPNERTHSNMHGYHWHSVCNKLIEWDKSYTLPLLDSLLTAMGEEYRLSYDSDVEPLASELVKADPYGAWNVIKKHIEATLPKWRSDILNWLKGGLRTFNESDSKGVLTDISIQLIIEWIQEDPEQRSSMLAHAVPATLDDDSGGQLTKELLQRYSKIDGVISGISATFHSGSWSGLTSDYYRRKREKLRNWLAAGYGNEITLWIESEIGYLDKDIESEEIKEERERFD